MTLNEILIVWIAKGTQGKIWKVRWTAIGSCEGESRVIVQNCSCGGFTCNFLKVRSSFSDTKKLSYLSSSCSESLCNGWNAVRSVTHQSRGTSVLMYPTPRTEWHPNYAHWVRWYQIERQNIFQTSKLFNKFSKFVADASSPTLHPSVLGMLFLLGNHFRVS